MWMDDYSQWVEKKTKKIFKKIRYLDQWNINAQVFILALGVIPPTMFTVYYLWQLLYVGIYNYTVDLKYKRLNS